MSKVCIVLNAKDKREIEERILKLYDESVDHYSVVFQPGFTDQITPDTSEVLLSGGSKAYLKDNPGLGEEVYEFIRNSNVPVFGICFGAQLIARAFGAGIVQLPTPCRGLCSIRVLEQKEIFENKYIAQVYKNQSWSLQNLAPEFAILACSSEGIEMFAHRDRPIAGVQFHPEQFGQVSDGEMLFRNLRRMLLDRPSNS